MRNKAEKEKTRFSLTTSMAPTLPPYGYTAYDVQLANESEGDLREHDDVSIAESNAEEHMLPYLAPFSVRPQKDA